MNTVPMPLLRSLINPRTSAGLIAVTLGAFGTLSATPTSAIAQSQGNASFWTQFTPSTDTRLIFVSSSTGNDSNSGLSPDRPVKSLTRAYNLLRDGHPDWMLLKRGDVWNEILPNWSKSGRAENEKMILGAYGDSPDRPQVRPGPSSVGLNVVGTDTIRHIAFVGFHLEPQQRATGEGNTGIRWLRNSEDIHFEDIYISGFTNNVTFQAYPSDNVLRDFRINGCVIVDSWSGGGHSQGLFAQGLDGFVLENSVIDRNGWNPDMGIQPTTFNHNLYIQSNNSGVVIRNNVISNASATGVQLRSGGLLHDNLFISNPVGFIIGAPAPYRLGTGVDGDARRNLVMYGRPIGDTQPLARGTELTNVGDVILSDNIYYQSVHDYNGQPILVHGTMNGGSQSEIEIKNNTIVDWRGSISINAEAEPNTYGLISIQSNLIIANLDNTTGNSNLNKPMVGVYDTSDSRISIENNVYKYFDTHNRPFFDRGSPVQIPAWQSNIEPSASFQQLDRMPDGLDLSDYLQHIGHNGDREFFVMQARELSRNNVDPKFSSTNVYTWMRAQIGN